MPIPVPIKTTPLSAVLGVNALTVCDCGATAFKVGIAYNPDTGNNFIRILECVDCGYQMLATHQSDASLAPSVGTLSQ
jgi:hypothetical protein